MPWHRSQLARLVEKGEADEFVALQPVREEDLRELGYIHMGVQVIGLVRDHSLGCEHTADRFQHEGGYWLCSRCPGGVIVGGHAS